MKIHFIHKTFAPSLIVAALILSACAVPQAAPGNNSGAAPVSTAVPAVVAPSPTAPVADAPVGPTATVVAIGGGDAPAASTTPTPEATPVDTREMEIQPVLVEGLDVQVLESKPVQVNATVNGTLGDGCTSLNTIDQARTGNEFTITVTVKRPKDAMCTMIAKMFNKSIALDVAGLKAGTYIVSSGALSQTFTLATDN